MVFDRRFSADQPGVRLTVSQADMAVSWAKPSDTVANMAQITKNALYRRVLAKQFGYPRRTVLLSGSGNILINAADDIVRDRRMRRPRDPDDAEGQVDKVILAGGLGASTRGSETSAQAPYAASRPDPRLRLRDTALRNHRFSSALAGSVPRLSGVHER